MGSEMAANLFTHQTMIGLADGGDSTEPQSRLARKNLRHTIFTLNENELTPHPPPPVRGGGRGMNWFTPGNS